MDEMMDGTQGPRKAGSIRRISVENFMCHSNLTIELGDRVNFITGQNGSGKSAILTALCVAFGIKARGTQRANTMKDFIKNGCRYGTVSVELNNEGEDAFRPEIYGNAITVERLISDNRSSFVLKDSEGRKIGVKKGDLDELVEHFNIDVENPCVIMTQDKSREFLHGGSDKDKFKFFFRATLLQEFSELILKFEANLEDYSSIIKEFEDELHPSEDALQKIKDQIKILEEVEVQVSEIEKLEKIYAWSWVKEAEKALIAEENKLTELQKRRPVCQKKIDEAQKKVEEKREALVEKKDFIAKMKHSTQELRQSQDKLQEALSEATRERVQAEEATNRIKRSIQEMLNRLHGFEQHVSEIQQRMLQDTQAEANERLQQTHQLECSYRIAEEDFKRIQGEESQFSSEAEAFAQQKSVLTKEVEEKKAQLQEIRSYIQQLRSQMSNTVLAFGGDKVLDLLQVIERGHHKFYRPPLGPIGAHVSYGQGLIDDVLNMQQSFGQPNEEADGIIEKSDCLNLPVSLSHDNSHVTALGDDSWSLAMEVAVGKMLNAFVVSNQRDVLLLRQLANSVRYHNLQIFTHDFNRQLIRPPPEMVPDVTLTTVLSSLRSDNATIINVLIDQGSVERQVLAKDYDAGKRVVFDGGSTLGRNVKEVITMDGTRMYARAGAETTLPRDRRVRGGRLGVHVDEQIHQAQAQESELKVVIEEAESRKHKIEDDYRRLKERSDFLKRKRLDCERALRRQEIQLQDLKSAHLNKGHMSRESNMIELERDIAQTREELESKEEKLSKSEIKLGAATSKWRDAKSQLDSLCESIRGDLESLHAAEQELLLLEEELRLATESLQHFHKVMEQKVDAEVVMQEAVVQEHRKQIEVYRQQATQLCPEEERQSLGDDTRTRDQLSTWITTMRERVIMQKQQSEPIGELMKKRSKLARRINSKLKYYANQREKLDMLLEALAGRKKKYRRSCLNMRRELTWGFNGHLGKKGFSGNVDVDYENKALTMTVQMPQDASNTAVRDTRALSGGERSFSTLAFALAMHNMTEAPFRAMDEFDVFMDAVSRKISLDTVVDAALQEGSQWIFITPHDISSLPGRAPAESVLKNNMWKELEAIYVNIALCCSWISIDELFRWLHGCTVKGGPHVKKQQMSAPRP